MTAKELVAAQGWTFREAERYRYELETCPFCKKGNWGHFYLDVSDGSREGLHKCYSCGVSGNLITLKQHLGIAPDPVPSKAESLPDVEACHQALLEDEDALDYLMNGRGFSHDIIRQQRIGLKTHYFRGVGEARAIVYPFMVGNQCIWAQYRTLPTMPLSTSTVRKAFNSPSGYDAALYNGQVLLREGITEIVLVEGPADCIAAMDKGVVDICGVPGANHKKAEWLDALDKLEKVYIWYDKDKAGQKAAQVLASRVGLEKCWCILLPDFTITTSEGESRPGKDANEWFAYGHGTKEGYEALKAKARLFDVDGVSSSQAAVQEFLDELNDKGSAEARYKSTRWPTLNKYVSFDTGDVIDILAPEKIGKTTFGMNLLEDMVATYGDNAVIICLEMTREKIARKWLCHKAGIADNLPKNPAEAHDLLQAFRQAGPRVQEETAQRPGTL